MIALKTLEMVTGEAALMTKLMYEDHHHEYENESNGDDGVDDQG